MNLAAKGGWCLALSVSPSMSLAFFKNNAPVNKCLKPSEHWSTASVDAEILSTHGCVRLSSVWRSAKPLEVRRGLLVKPATISPNQQKYQPLALKMPFLFGCLYCTLFPKLSDMRTWHCTEEMGSGPSKVTGRGGEMVLFPLILLSPFQQKE